jgi:hypothetical protein
MLLGGLAQSLLGLAVGEWAELTADRFTLPAIYSFFHLLVFGSLIGFVAYTWLLEHVPTSQASTYAYVNPVVAIVIGALLGDHGITLPMVAGVFVILTGVALVRSQGHNHAADGCRRIRNPDRCGPGKKPGPRPVIGCGFGAGTGRRASSGATPASSSR